MTISTPFQLNRPTDSCSSVPLSSSSLLKVKR